MNSRLALMNIGVIGTGLIGSSLIRAITARALVKSVSVFDTNTDYLVQLDELGLPCVPYARARDLAQNCDLIFVCTPVKSIGPTICELIRTGSPKTVITDVGSVKSTIIDEVRSKYPDFEHYVPGHPMAGSDASGPRFGKKDLFEGKPYILTPYARTNPDDLRLITEIVKGIGAKPSQLDAAQHDKIVGLISHLPHLYAFALMHAVSDLSKSTGFDVSQYAGEAFMDVTRIASSDERMWLDIFDDNDAAIEQASLALQGQMRRFLEAMTERDLGEISALIRQAREMRIDLEKRRSK